MKTENAVLLKSKAFAIRIIKIYQFLSKKQEYVLAKQLVRCGTSIGANVREAIRSHSRKEFIAKMAIALKESSETEYWLELLLETGYLNRTQFESIYCDCKELVRLLMAIVKTSKIRKIVNCEL